MLKLNDVILIRAKMSSCFLTVKGLSRKLKCNQAKLEKVLNRYESDTYIESKAIEWLQKK